MDKNKSIDGLTTRSSKKTASSKSSKTTNIKTPKSHTTKSTKSTEITTTESTEITKSTKSTESTEVTKSTKSTKSARATGSTKSIKPSKSTRSAKPHTKPLNSSLTTKPATDIKPSAPHSELMDEPVNSPNDEPANTPSDEPIADPIADFLSPVQTFDFDEQSGELRAASDSSPVPPSTKKPKKEKKKMSKKRKITLWVISIIVILLFGATIWFILWGNDIIAKITGGQGNLLDLLTFTEETYDPLKTDEKGRTNILAFGTSGYNMEGDEGNGTHDGAQLTDSIMVISLNQETGDLAMLSLPRDLKASPTCTATGKINEVYWCNGGGGDASTETEATAAKALTNEVGSILGLDFQYFAHLNWESLIQIVDTLGGINVTLDEGVYDYYYTKAVFEPNIEYTIDGAQALGLARARHGTTSGDFTRGASQQKILIGIKDKIFEKSLSLTDIMGLATVLGDNLRTNFSLSEIKTLAHLTTNFDFNAMRQISLLEPEHLMTTGTINGISYVLPTGGVGYYTKIQNYLAKMLDNDPRVYEDATILVLNGTETPGLASAEQTTLTEAGYQNITIDDAPAGEYNDQYTLYALNSDKPGTKSLLEEKYSQTSKPSSELPAGINTNYDFILIIGDSPTE